MVRIDHSRSLKLTSDSIATKQDRIFHFVGASGAGKSHILHSIINRCTQWIHNSTNSTSTSIHVRATKTIGQKRTSTEGAPTDSGLYKETTHCLLQNGLDGDAVKLDFTKEPARDGMINGNKDLRAAVELDPEDSWSLGSALIHLCGKLKPRPGHPHGSTSTSAYFIMELVSFPVAALMDRLCLFPDGRRQFGWYSLVRPTPTDAHERHSWPSPLGDSPYVPYLGSRLAPQRGRI